MADTLPNLMPCPFCGGDARLISGGPGNHFVKCDGCGASSDDRSIEGAAGVWNRRADASARLHDAINSPTLPSADELEVVAWAETATIDLHPKHRKIVTDAGTVLREGKDKFTALVTASALSSAQAQIERIELTRGAVSQLALDAIARAEAAEAEVKRLEGELTNANVAVDAFSEICDELGVERDNEAGLIAAHNLKEEVKRLREATNQCRLAFSGMVSVQSAIDLLDSTALSGGTSNDR
jgi:hypothetical protein